MVKWMASWFVGIIGLFLFPSYIFAYYINMPASMVIGQSSFTDSTAHVTQSGLKVPDDLIIVNGKLIIADQQADRVLIWNTVPTSSGTPADIVLGQSNFTS